MSTSTTLACAILALVIVVGAEAREAQISHTRVNPLDVRLEHFDVTDAILRDALSELSLKDVNELHLGFEEIIRDKVQDDPRANNPHFSLHLGGKSLREVLVEICRSDIRYTWSKDGATINVFPRATADDSSYLLNLRIERMSISDIANPDQALTPLSRLFPGEQIGYFGSSLGDNAYAKPWTSSFERVTVRQFINRAAENMGSRTSWVWEGGQGERMFTFLKGSFHTR